MILARLFVAIGGLIVLVLTVALVGPYFVDWTSYRADFEREASAVLGRRVTVNGTAEARLLPFPSVTFSNVSVGGGAGGEPAMTVETFSMDAELAPFLRGEFLIFDMRMVRPKMLVEVAQDGTVDWSVRPSAPAAISSVSLERLTVTDGQVEIRHRLSGRTHLVDAVNAEIAAKSLRGPWRLEGAARIDGIATTLALATGAIDDQGAMRLRVKVTPADGFSIDADGQAALAEKGLGYTGTFRIAEIANGKADRQAKQGKAPPGYRVSGNFALDNGKLDVSDFRFETGPLENPYTADGKAVVEFGAAPRFSIEADGAQVRLDEAIGAPEGTSLTLEERLAAFETVLASLPKPSIPGKISVDLPAVLVGDTTVRDVRMAAEPAEGGWSVRSAAATLPGRTTVEASGFLQTEGNVGFNGSLLVAVAQPSGFAAWLAKDIDEAIRRLPAAGFSAKVELGEKRQVFRDLELMLGEARFKGEIDSRQPGSARPTVFVKLDGGAVSQDGVAALAALFVSDAGRNRFEDTDFDLEVKAGPVTVAGLAAESIDTALRLRRHQLEIDRLSIGGLAGASISATGAISDFPEAPAGRLDASIVSVDLAPLAHLASTTFPANRLLAELDRRTAAFPALLTDARADIVASAATNADGTTAVALSLQGDIGGSALSASLSASGRPEDVRDVPFSLSFSARNPEGAALLALAGLPTLPVSSPGGGEISLSLEGTAAGGLKTKAELRGDGLLAAFDGTAAIGDDGLSAKGTARLSSDDIEPWLLTAGATYPGMGLGMQVELTAQADFDAGLLVLDGLNGAIGETAVAGDLNAEIKDGMRRLSGALVLDDLALDPFAETVLGEGTLAGEDDAWASVPFAQQASPPFNADVGISVARVTAGGAELYDTALRLRLDGEGLRVDDLKASFAGGSLTGRGELKNTAGTGLLSAQFALTDAALDTDGLSAKADLSATVSGSGKSLGGLVASLAGSGTARLDGISIAGFDAAALPALLARADAIGRDIDPAKTAAFAKDIVAGGNFAGGAADVAFTLAGGVLRAPPVTLANPAAMLSAESRIDLSADTASLSGQMGFAPGEAAQAGSEPAVRYTAEGPIGAVRIAYDTEPLAQFLTQRALEKEQARVEAMQAALLEKQRLRREVRYYASLQSERERQAAEALRASEEAARQKAAEAERQRAEAAAKAAEEAVKAAEDAARAAEEQRRRDAEAAEKARRIDERAAGEPVDDRAAGEPVEPAVRTGAEAPEATQDAAVDGAAGPAALDDEPKLPSAGDIPVPEPRADATTARPAVPAPANVEFPPAPPNPSTIDSFLRSLSGG